MSQPTESTSRLREAARWLSLGLALYTGCVTDVTGDDDSLGETTQDLYVRPTTVPWGANAAIPMCFAWATGTDVVSETGEVVHGATAIPVGERAGVAEFVKERMRLTWGSVLGFQPTYRECPTSGSAQEVMIELAYLDGGGGHCALGRSSLSTPAQRAAGTAPGCHIAIPSTWSSSQGALVYAQMYIIHELGHMLGFSHEFNRPDAGVGGACGGQRDFSLGGTIGPFDVDSIMSSTYRCRLPKPEQHWLSPGDVVNARSVLGARTPPNAAKDILWQNTTGGASIYRMSGSLIGREDPLPAPGSEYRIIGSGDFDGNSVGDLLWRAPNGDVVIWLLNAEGGVIASGFVPVPTEYSVQGIARFNSDATDDVMWRSSQTGTLVTWMMNGASIAYSRQLAAPNQVWQVKQVGDFNKDGQADLFWRDTGSSTSVWLLNDASVVLGTSQPGTADSSWSVKAVGDFNGDRMSDVFWQRTNGATSIWFMNGNSLLSYGSPPAVGAGWQVQIAADVDADGKSDLLWRNTNGDTRVWFMNGLAVRLNLPLRHEGTSWNMVGALRGTVTPVYESSSGGIQVVP